MCSKVFSQNQVDTLNSGKRANKWNDEDIASCIALRSISPKCYKYLYETSYPLAGWFKVKLYLNNSWFNFERN